MKTRAPVYAMLLALFGGAARADVQACFDAAVRGQRLQREGHLLAAHEAFATCGAIACPDVVVQQCTGWLAAVDEATPTVVLRALDDQGRDVDVAAVTVDGAARPEALAGRAVALDPGPHEIRWQSADGASTRELVTVREHEKARSVVGVFRAAPRAAAPPARAAAPPARADRGFSAPFIASAATAVVAAGVFTYFAARGYSDRQALGCDVGCGSSQYGQVRAELVAADVALGVAAVAAVAALWLALRPRDR